LNVSPPTDARCVWPLRAVLGEGPIWRAREDALYFVDIKGPALHRYSLGDGAKQSWPMPEMIGWIVERSDNPGFIAGLESGFSELNHDTFALAKIADPEPHLLGNRMNDAKADRWGRIWAGTMDNAEKSAAGSLYCLYPDRSWRRADTGYLVPNGPTFSPEGDILYHADSGRRTIYRFQLNADGALSGKSVFTVFVDDEGYPDGMTTDSEGCLWVAHWGGARISRFRPDGALDRIIPMPVSQPTSCAFAGEHLDRLFITSASIGVESEELAGGLFEIRPGVRGLPPNAYAG
jgi:sugar lactone lactonase YvrE